MKFFPTLLLALVLPLPFLNAAEKVSVAAAANLVYALETLNAEFKRAEPDVTLTVVTGASGNLVAQIRNGAPFDVFLSADVEYPRALIAAGQASADTFMVFATGRLVLWTTKPTVLFDSIEVVVRSQNVNKIAIANPATAPYGRAANQTLEKLGLLADAQPKLVMGENITQTAQFVETGNADAGFVALSLVLSPKLKDRGRWLEVPDELHEPLDQGAVLTLRGAQNAAAVRYLTFLRSEGARRVLERFGYRVPAMKSE